MTTILIDCKKKIVYADKRCTQRYDECEFYSDKFNKIHTHEGKVIVGTGSVNDIAFFVKRVKMDSTPPNPKGDGSTVFIISDHTDGLDISIFKSEKGFFANKWVMVKSIVCDTFITSGSGSEYAHGAFAICGDGERAIQAASKYDSHTGCEVDKYELKKEKP